MKIYLSLLKIKTMVDWFFCSMYSHNHNNVPDPAHLSLRECKDGSPPVQNWVKLGILFLFKKKSNVVPSLLVTMRLTIVKPAKVQVTKSCIQFVGISSFFCLLVLGKGKVSKSCNFYLITFIFRCDEKFEHWKFTNPWKTNHLWKKPKLWCESRNCKTF